MLWRAHINRHRERTGITTSEHCNFRDICVDIFWKTWEGISCKLMNIGSWNCDSIIMTAESDGFERFMWQLNCHYLLPLKRKREVDILLACSDFRWLLIDHLICAQPCDASRLYRDKAHSLVRKKTKWEWCYGGTICRMLGKWGSAWQRQGYQRCILRNEQLLAGDGRGQGTSLASTLGGGAYLPGVAHRHRPASGNTMKLE